MFLSLISSLLIIWQDNILIKLHYFKIYWDLFYGLGYGWPQWVFCVHLKRTCVLQLLGRQLCASSRSRAGLPHPHWSFCLLVLSVTEKGVESQPRLWICLFLSTVLSSFASFVYFEALSWSARMFVNINSLDWSPFHYEMFQLKTENTFSIYLHTHHFRCPSATWRTSLSVCYCADLLALSSHSISLSQNNFAFLWEDFFFLFVGRGDFFSLW